MNIKIVIFLMLVISVDGLCFAQSDSGNKSDLAGNSYGNDMIDQQGNLFPNSSSEKADGVYTIGSNDGTNPNGQGNLFRESTSEKTDGVYTDGSDSDGDTDSQSNLFPESSSGKKEGAYGLSGGITTH